MEERLLTPQQEAFLSYYINPKSETFGNARASALKAGYSENYANNITVSMPEWLIRFTKKRDISQDVYFIYCPMTNRIKIGKTGNLKSRITQIKAQSSCGDKYVLLFTMKDFEDNAENYLHEQFNDLRVNGEWFELKDDLENFIDNVLNESPTHQAIKIYGRIK